MQQIVICIHIHSVICILYILYNSVEVLHSLHFAHAESYLMQVPSDFFYNEC